MKHTIFLISLAFLSLSATAQIKDTVGLNIPISDGNIIYEGVIEMPGKKQADLYSNAKQWFVDYFVSSKEVIQNEDKEAGKIIGKGVVPVYYKQIMTLELKCKQTIQIDCRDGKYRYRIYDMILTNPPSEYTSSHDYAAEGFINNLIGQKPDNAFSKGQSKKILKGLNTAITETIASLKKAMNSKTDTF